MSKTETKEIKTVARKPITNPRDLPWPQDVDGMTQHLRRGGGRAIGRIGGKKERLERVLETLEVLAQYAQDKYDLQIANIERERKAEAVRLQRDAERVLREEEASVAAKLQRAKALNEEVAAIRAKRKALTKAATIRAKREAVTKAAK